MKIAEYQKQGIPLESLSLQVLRNIDITTPEEEQMIQGLVNARLQHAPVEVTINRETDNTDFKNKDDESKFQEEIDKRVRSAKPEIERKIEVEGGQEPEIEVKVNNEKFCQFCDAKGPIKHKNSCSRLEISKEADLSEKIDKLKQQRNVLE